MNITKNECFRRQKQADDKQSHDVPNNGISLFHIGYKIKKSG